MTTAAFVVSFVVVAIIVCADVSVQKPQVTIDAAYSDNDYINMLFDDQIAIIDRKSKWELITLRLRNINVPDTLFELDRQAAFSTLNSYLTRYVNVLFYGKKGGLNVTFEPHEIKATEMMYGSEPNFVSEGGPDAAAKIGDKVYFFKGCQVALFNHNAWGTPVSAESLGMPCDVDAAWNDSDGDADGDAMFVLKGDQLWRWKLDGSMEGPNPFNSIYNVRSWTLKPTEGQ